MALKYISDFLNWWRGRRQASNPPNIAARVNEIQKQAQGDYGAKERFDNGQSAGSGFIDTGKPVSRNPFTKG